MHQSSLNNMRAFRDVHLDHRRLDPLTILDLGSMDIHGCYRPLFDAPAWTYTTWMWSSNGPMIGGKFPRHPRMCSSPANALSTLNFSG